MVAIVKGTNQKAYLDDGGFEKAMRMFPPEYLDYHNKEEFFFRDNIHEGANVLDVGCGELRTTVPIAVHVGHIGKVIGIDFDERMCELAKKKSQVLKNVEVRKVDAREIDKMPENFDYIVLGFEFLGLLPSAEQVPFLRKAKEKLNPRGAILATVFSEYAPSAQFKTYTLISPPQKIRYDGTRVYMDKYGYSAETFSRSKIRKRFVSAGMKPEVRELTRMAYSVKASV